VGDHRASCFFAQFAIAIARAVTAWTRRALRRGPTTAMTHIAIQEQLDGKAVEWIEQVSDAQYQSAATT
jgi:hypothetical protein